MKNRPSSPLAYSYVRFSHPSQAEGDSERRQDDAAADWCRRHNVRLDTSLTFRDLGKSAYLGKHRENPDRHDLARFLKLVEDGRVPRGAYFIIENLDRLSREHIRPALTLLLNLIEAGVRVVQLKPAEQVFDEQVEPMALMMAIMELSRGHSESKMKSERVGKAWAEKRQEARQGGVLTRRLPAWIEERNGKLHLIPERAAVVKRIFHLAANGYGSGMIVKVLTEEGVPAFGKKGWIKMYVSRILTDRRALGEFQLKSKGQPDGELIEGYFPAVVAEAEWSAARAAAIERRRPMKERGEGKGEFAKVGEGAKPPLPGRVGKYVNLFSGMLFNARDGDAYYATVRVSGDGVPRRLLMTASANNGRGACRVFPLGTFEAAILVFLKEVDPREIIGRDEGPDEIMVLSGELARVESSIALIVAEMDERGESPTLFQRLRKQEDRKQDLTARLAEARQKAAHPLSETWGEVKSLAAVLDNARDPRDARLRLRAVLRRAIDSIWMVVASRGLDRLAAVQVWFKGEEKFRNYRILHRPARGNRDSQKPGRIWVESMRYYVTPGVIDLRKKEDAEYELEMLLAWDPERDAEEGDRFLLKGTIVGSHD